MHVHCSILFSFHYNGYFYFLLFSANDHVWVELTYGGGDRYGSHCNNENRKGRIVFICDPLIAGKVCLRKEPESHTGMSFELWVLGMEVWAWV